MTSMATTPIARAKQPTLKVCATNRAHKARRWAADDYIVESGRSGNLYLVTLNVAPKSDSTMGLTGLARIFG